MPTSEVLKAANIAKLYFYGAARTVTGSNYLLEVRGLKILVDCGIFQGPAELRKKNNEPFPYDPKDINFVLVTHAHLDHIGRIPKLVKEGFKGQIIATSPTIDVAEIMFKDSQKLAEEHETNNSFWTDLDVASVMAPFSPIGYDQKFELNKDVICFFRNSGHVLGSAMVEIWIRKKPKQSEFTKIIFTGDIGSNEIPFALLEKPTLIDSVDYLIIESTYGDRNHPSVGEVKNLLEDIVESTISKKGVLMIPVPALERSQQILYHLNELAENHRIPYVPIYVDSPMAIALTDIYRKNSDFLNQEAKKLVESGEAIFKFPGLSYTASAHESKMINKVLPPKIVMAGSSVSEGGRILHHELRYLADANNSLLVVSYQMEGTLGRKILDGDKQVRVMDQMVDVKANIQSLGGYSDHIDQHGLFDLIFRVKQVVKKIFITHGEEKCSLALRQAIMDNLGILSEVPKLGEVFEIDYTK